MSCAPPRREDALADNVCLGVVARKRFGSGCDRRRLEASSRGRPNERGRAQHPGRDLMKRLAFLVVVALCSLGLAAPVLAAAPSNDTYATRHLIEALPFSDSLDTSEA